MKLVYFYNKLVIYAVVSLKRVIIASIPDISVKVLHTQHFIEFQHAISQPPDNLETKFKRFWKAVSAYKVNQTQTHMGLFFVMRTPPKAFFQKVSSILKHLQYLERSQTLT